MLKNYIKIAWRNISRSRLYSLVNIIGLSTGIAFCLLIGAYIWGELRVNHELKNPDQQFILQSKWKQPNMGYELATVGPLAKALREQYPNLVANYYRWDGITTNVSKGDKVFREGIEIGDTTLLSMYGFGLMHGNAATALNEPFSAVVTPQLAQKYFDRTDVVGETITIESFSGTRKDFMITGVLKNIPRNSVTEINDDNKNQVFLPEKCLSFFGRDINQWQNIYVASNVELQKNVTPKDLEKPIQQLLKDNTPATIHQNLEPYLVPFSTYHLVADNGLVQSMIYTLTCIAGFILLMAVVNFINLCVSRSSSRMKEIGLRKVLGGMRKQLIRQFLVESVLLVSLATFFSLFIYEMCRPYFSNFLGRPITGILQFPSYFIAIPVLLSLAIGLLAGIYPALVLSAMKSVDSLKGKLKTVKENVILRKTLVAFQFGTAAIVFIGALIITQQVSFFFSKDLGYNKDYVLYAQAPRNWTPEGVRKMETIREEFSRTPGVTNVALSYEITNGQQGNNVRVFKKGSDSTQAGGSMILVSDNQYADTYSIPIKAGSFFSPVYRPEDSLHVVINEAQSKALGWNDPQDAIGKQIRAYGFNDDLTIAGVTKDFHFGAMKDKIEPIIFFNVQFYTTYRFFSFKLKPGGIEKNIAALQKKWATLLPGTAFEYKFIDDALAKVYKTEIQLKKAAYTATVLAFIIVLLGIVGLISLSIQKRTKEIGIRKVLGSSVSGIIQLFLKEFIWTIGIAALIACPISYILMQQWLNGYAYRISITSYPFIISISVLIIITTLLITAQTIKAALTNPAKSLRTE